MEAADQLPYAAFAVVPPEKVREYLLNRHHLQNKGKAQFYEQIGYSLTRDQKLAEDLKAIARTGTVTRREPTPRGTKYVVAGTLTAPNGREYPLLTVWIIQTHQTEPRLVTAYPNKN